MARLFISHSTANNAAAIALGNWLSEQGFDDLYLDIDPARGIVPGERWQEALKAAADRCEAVLFLISPAWLASKWCLAEFLLAKSLHKRIFGVIVEPVPFEQLPAEMTAEWQLCELVGEDRLRRFKVEVLGRPAEVTFREVGLDLLRRGLERAGLDARSFPWPPREEPNRAPYRGLKALEPQDAAIFFGRDAWIVRAIDRIRGLLETDVDKILVVLGASGSGKSSFLRAGLWPRLARDNANFLPLPVIRPQTAVLSGSTGLAVAISGAFDRLGVARSRGAVREALAEGPDVFARLLDELSSLAQRRLVAVDEAEAHPAIVLPLDQAEELFAAEGEVETAAFLDLLAGVLAPTEAQPTRRLLVVATMRSDRYELLQAEPRLAAIKQDLFNLPPLPPAEFKSIIEGPAGRISDAGTPLDIDAALTEQLVADAQGVDALPLLAFTLERLYTDYGTSGRLTIADYQKLGGVQGSLEAAVAGALANPGGSPAIPADKEVQLGLIRSAFIPWLARIDPETGAPMRRLALLDEIPEGSRAIIDRLVDARLLVADRRAGVDRIEVAHESLLRQWSALTAWLDIDAADLKLIEGVERAAGEWARNGRLEAWLDHRADRLAAADRLIARDDFRRRLGEEGAAYLAACGTREAAERQASEEALAREQARLAEIAAAQVRTARLQRRGRWALAAIAIAVLGGLGLGVWQRQINLEQRQINLEQHHANLALQSGLEVRQRALDDARVNLVTDQAISQQARGNWDAALRLAVYGARLGLNLDQKLGRTPLARAELSAAISQVGWRLVFGGHDDVVRSVAFSPDGSRIVTASLDKTARVWDAATGRQIAVLQGHRDKVVSANFSPNGKYVLTASVDHDAAIWDLATTKPIVVFHGHERPILSAAFSPDGSRVVTASDDNTARIWMSATGQEMLVLRGHEAGLWSAAFSPDGSRVVTASDDKTARIWDAATGKQILVLQGRLPFWTASFSPDGRKIITAGFDHTARVWDAQTAKELAVLLGHEGIVSSAVFSPDGSRIATASWDKTARIWPVPGGVTVIGVLCCHQFAVSSAVFSPDGKRVLTAAINGLGVIWDAATAKALRTLRLHDNIWDDSIVSSAAFSPDGSRIVTASWDKTARIWDTETGHEIAVLRGHESEVRSAAFSPDGLRIVTASADRTARIWDVATKQAIAVLRGHEGEVMAAAFSPDGARVVTGSQDKTARLWDAGTGNQIAVMNHLGNVVSVAFSPDGSQILTASADNLQSTAWLWDTATLKEVAVFRGHDLGIWSATFSPDGSRVLTASMDGTARIWDVVTAREIAEMRGHKGPLHAAAFSPDGSRVVTASDDETARVWDVHFAKMPAKDLIAEACIRRLGPLTVLTRDEMRLAGYPDSKAGIDICKTIGSDSAASAAPTDGHS